MPSLNQITTNQLNRKIGTPDCPVIIDVTLDEDFDADPYLIPTAIRHPHTHIHELAERYQNQKLVLICQKGKKLSEGAAAILRTLNIQAEYLEGGNFGWRDAGFARIPNSSIPWSGKKTVWVTRHRPKIDRIACPWFVRRFVDRNAQFLFVSPSEVSAVAEKFNATPFDIENTFLSHRGDKCTFDTMLEEFELKSEPLTHLAKIIRGADTNRLDLAPESAGLMAASLGLSRMYRDDLEQLDAGLGLYDAFYRWARDATSETHEWPGSQVKK